MPAPLSNIDTRVRVFDRAGTLLGTFAGIDLQWSNGKDNGAMSFTAHQLEDDYAFDVFDDAIGVVQMLLPTDPAVPEVTSWQVIGPPYLLTSSGTVVASGETAALTVQVTGVNALALLSEWQVLHGPDSDGAGTVNRRGPDELVYNYAHPLAEISGVPVGAATETTRASIASDAARKGKPTNWEVQAADWLSMSGGGGRALFIFAEFTPDTTDLYRIATAADEEHDVLLLGEGQGGIVSSSTAQETGYEYRVDFDEVLESGKSYLLAATMTKVDSAGGDGLDAISYYVGKVGQKNKVAAADVLISSETGAAAASQALDDPIPGLTVGGLVKTFRNENRHWMGLDSSAELVTLDFDEDEDSAGVAWDNAGQRSWAFGTPISQVLGDLGDIADFDMAYGKILKAYQDKGADLSATVILESAADGGTLLSWTWDTRPITATRVTFRTDDGYGKKIDTDLEVTVAPRSAFIETQQSSSVGDARRLGGRYINENGVVRKVYSGEWVAVLGVIPGGYDFDWGDTVSGLNRVGDAHDVRCITWAGRRMGTDGPIVFSGEFQ